MFKAKYADALNNKVAQEKDGVAVKIGSGTVSLVFDILIPVLVVGLIFCVGPKPACPNGLPSYKKEVDFGFKHAKEKFGHLFSRTTWKEHSRDCIIFWSILSLAVITTLQNGYNLINNSDSKKARVLKKIEEELV